MSRVLAAALAAALLSCGNAVAAASPVRLGGIAELEAADGTRVRPCGASELELQRRAMGDARLLLCGVITDAAGHRVRYDFVRTGRVEAPGPGTLRSESVTQALAEREAARPATRFVGWRRRPMWASERYALLWAYDVSESGRPRTLSYTAICTREGVLLLTRLDARPEGFDRDELAFVAIISEVTVKPGRRFVDAASQDARASFTAADLVANRGRAVAVAAAHTPGPRVPMVAVYMGLGVLGLLALLSAVRRIQESG
jgi:hypothetical protein